MLAIMTIQCARLFNWSGGSWSKTDTIDNIIPKLPDGRLCTHKSKFENYKGITSLVLMASDRNMGYPQGADKSHYRVTKELKSFFNYAAERDPNSCSHPSKRVVENETVINGVPSMPKRMRKSAGVERLSPTKAGPSSSSS